MVNEVEFRHTLSSSFPRHCPFEKSIATHCVECPLAEKHNLAEREVVSCLSAPAHKQCHGLLTLLRENFTFALGKSRIDGPLPHAKEMRMQCGGLKGIQFAVDGGSDVRDVAGLLEQAVGKFGDIADLPFTLVVKRAMSTYKSR